MASNLNTAYNIWTWIVDMNIFQEHNDMLHHSKHCKFQVLYNKIQNIEIGYISSCSQHKIFSFLQWLLDPYFYFFSIKCVVIFYHGFVSKVFAVKHRIWFHHYIKGWKHMHRIGFILYILGVFSCAQAALWMVFSVRLSICPSVTPFWLCFHHRIIIIFSGIVNKDQGKVHAKGQGQRSKDKVTEVTTQLNHFRTVTPVWIHIWWWNDTYSLMLVRKCALLFFKVICQISRSHGAKNHRIWPRLGVSRL